MILHIFKKDARRLWPAIAVSLIVLGSLAWHDRWRSDRMVGQAEGYLNMLAPLAWACLLALAVEQEPIAGDRQFWITRPYRRRDLLTAKLLFAALFVHLPILLADVWILKARGFPPLTYAGELLSKQIVLSCALTLPAMALASLVRSFAHFVLELVAVAVAFVVLASVYWTPAGTWEVFETLRWQVVIVVAAAGAAAILPLQYFGRRVVMSRGIAVAAGTAAVLLFSFFLPQSALAIRSSMAPAKAELALRMEPPKARRTPGWSPMYSVAIPVELTGVPPGTQARITVMRSRIEGAGGSWQQGLRTMYRPFDRPPFYLGFAGSPWEESAPKFLRIDLDPSVSARLKDGTATISVEAGITLYRPKQPVWMGTSETRDFGELGRCTSQMTQRTFTEQSLKVECESPRHDPIGTRVRLWSPETGRDWHHFMGEARTFVNGPRMAWLSPLFRDTTYIDVVPQGTEARYELRVPAELVPNARLEITRLEVLGYTSLKQEFRDVDLRPYLMRQPNRAGAK
jgi:hypothetical protein